MINNLITKKTTALTLITGLILLLSCSATASNNGILLDKIVAVVNDEIILHSELKHRVIKAQQELQARQVNTNIGQDFVLKVLDNMIMEKLQLQRIQQRGIKISDAELLEQIDEIARKNKLTTLQLRDQLNLAETNGFKTFSNNIRNQMLFQKLQQVEVLSKTQVTEGEITNYIQRQSLVNNNTEYHLAHIIVNLPESATPKQRDTAKKKAEKILSKLNMGEDFSQVAIRYSEGSKALLGGDLGWLGNDEIPTFFAQNVQSLEAGQHSKIIKSPIGFHIIKVIAKREKDSNIVKQFHLYRFLIPSDNALAKPHPPATLVELAENIDSLKEFQALNEQFSDIPAEVNANNDLGWLTIQEMPLSYAEAIYDLQVKKASKPIASAQGWEILYLNAIREKDLNLANKRQQAMNTLRRKKANETYEIWLRRLKEDALIDNRLAKQYANEK